MWAAAFILCMSGTRFGVNLPGIHPFEIITAVAYANAGPENCHLSTRLVNDRNPKLAGGPFFYQSCDAHLAVAIEISLEIRWVDPTGKVVRFSGRPVR